MVTDNFSGTHSKSDYLSMVSENGWSLGHVPPEYRDRAMCEAAIDNAEIQLTDNFSILSMVPQPLRDEAMCLRAVKRDGAAIRDVPETAKTYELCYQAIRQNGKELDRVPGQFRDEKMCLAAVSDDGAAILAVPETLATEDLWRIALRTRPELIKAAPKHVLTHELYVYLWRHTQKARIEFSAIRAAFPESVLKAVSKGTVKVAGSMYEDDFTGNSSRR